MVNIRQRDHSSSLVILRYIKYYQNKSTIFRLPFSPFCLFSALIFCACVATESVELPFKIKLSYSAGNS